MKQPIPRRTIISSRSHPPDLQPSPGQAFAPRRLLQQAVGWLDEVVARLPHRQTASQEIPTDASPPSPVQVLQAFEAQDRARTAERRFVQETAAAQPTAERLVDLTLAGLGRGAVEYHQALGEVLAMAPEHRTPSACTAAGLSERAARHIAAAVRALGEDGTTAPSPKGGCVRTLTTYIPFVRWDDTLASSVFNLADERGDSSTLFIMRLLKTAALMQRSMVAASAQMGAHFEIDIDRVLNPRQLEDHGWPEGPPDTWSVDTRIRMQMAFAPGLAAGAIPLVLKAENYATLTFAVEAFTACLRAALPGSLRPVEWVGMPCARQEVLPLLEKNLFAMWTARMLDLAGKGRARARLLVKYLASTDASSGAEQIVPSSLAAEIELDRLPNDMVVVLQASTHVAGRDDMETLLSPWWSPAASRLTELSMESIVAAREIG